MASTTRDAATQHWAGKAPSLSNGKWLKRALGAAQKRDRSNADPASPQGRWLADTLTDSSEQCILAYYHRPANTLRPRSAGSEGDLFAQLAAANTDVILNGHNHFYERTLPMDSAGNVVAEGGTVSFVVGTGDQGSRYRVELANFTATVVFGEQGLLRLDLGDDSYRWAFHSTSNAAVLDKGSRRCGSV